MHQSVTKATGAGPCFSPHFFVSFSHQALKTQGAGAAASEKQLKSMPELVLTGHEWMEGEIGSNVAQGACSITATVHCWSSAIHACVHCSTMMQTRLG